MKLGIFSAGFKVDCLDRVECAVEAEDRVPEARTSLQVQCRRFILRMRESRGSRNVQHEANLKHLKAAEMLRHCLPPSDHR